MTFSKLLALVEASASTQPSSPYASDGHSLPLIVFRSGTRVVRASTLDYPFLAFALDSAGQTEVLPGAKSANLALCKSLGSAFEGSNPSPATSKTS